MHRSLAALALTLLLALAAAPAAAQDDGGQDHDHHHGTAPEATSAELSAAEALLAATKTGVARFADSAVAAAEGYIQITPFAFYGVRAAHYHNETYNRDGALLDPERPEDLMYLKTDDGALRLIGVMYLAPAGEGPRPGGPLTAWHTHDDLCAGAAGVVPVDPAGACPSGTAPVTAEMLHVWLMDVDQTDDLAAAFGEEPPAAAADPDRFGGDAGTLEAGADLVDWTGVMLGVSRTLGIDLVELRRRYQAGESLAEMARSQGVEPADLVAAIVARVGADLDEAVARGDMTQAQRDLIGRQVPAWIERMVELHEGEPWRTDAGADETN